MAWELTARDSWSLPKGPMAMSEVGPLELYGSVWTDLHVTIPLAVVLTFARVAFSRHVGYHIGKRMIPAKKWRAVHWKFNEGLFRLFIYVGLALHGLHIESTWHFVMAPEECWRMWPQPVLPMLRTYYIAETALYLHLLISQFLIDNRRKDFMQMCIHHFVTLVLIIGSYAANFSRHGAAVMVLHDVSDVFLEAAKLANYASWSRTCDTLFVLFATVFFITRIVLLPTKVIFSGAVVSLDYIILYKAGTFLNMLLLVLFGLHVFWFSTIVSMCIKFLTKGKVENDARSDDDEPDEG